MNKSGFGRFTASRFILGTAVSVATIFSLPAQAIQFEWDIMGGIEGSWNTSVQLGSQWRIEERSKHLVGKLQNNNTLCPRAPNGAGTSCQGQIALQDPTHGPTGFNLNSFVGEGPGANQVFVNAPGQFSNNNDDGNLNFDKGDITQLVARTTSDLTLTWNEITFFGRGYYFWDAEGQNPELKSNAVVTPAAVAASGGLRRVNNGVEDSIPVIRNRTKINDQLGSAFQLLDFNLSGFLPFIGDRELSWKLGRQPINWGESTILIVNSLNTFNPPDVNNLFRPAFLDLAEVLKPVDALQLSTSITDSLSIEAFYQYRFEPAIIPAPGSYLSFIDVGSDNSRDYIQIGFGKGADNYLKEGIADQLLLSSVTDTDGIVDILDERLAEDGGQYGFVLRYFADWLNNGTEIALYHANYHSRLPYASFLAGDYGCLSAPGSPEPSTATLGDVAGPLTDTANFGTACPNADTALAVEASLPVGVAPANRDQVFAAGSAQDTFDAFNADTIGVFLEYPEDIKMYGISFNTSFGEISVQGEVAYRPEAPLQVHTIDLGLAAINPTFPQGCTGATCAPTSANDVYRVSLPGVGEVGGFPGRRYALPDYITQYRGINTLCSQAQIDADTNNTCLTPGDYIRGYEKFETYQFNLGATYIFGPGNWLFSDQIIFLAEAGATWVPDLPHVDELQIESTPSVHTHYSAGTDGTNANGGGPGTASNSLLAGPSGLRFNPTQANRKNFADEFSWGWRVVALIRYDSVLPNISFEDTIILWHDVDGNAPGPGENFVEDRKIILNNLEMRYKQNWSFVLGTAFFMGGNKGHNLLEDRDFVNLGARYRF